MYLIEPINTSIKNDIFFYFYYTPKLQNLFFAILLQLYKILNKKRLNKAACFLMVPKAGLEPA